MIMCVLLCYSVSIHMSRYYQQGVLFLVVCINLVHV